jgi:hypothetical protein
MKTELKMKVSKLARSEIAIAEWVLANSRRCASFASGERRGEESSSSNSCGRNGVGGHEGGQCREALGNNARTTRRTHWLICLCCVLEVRNRVSSGKTRPAQACTRSAAKAGSSACTHRRTGTHTHTHTPSFQFVSVPLARAQAQRDIQARAATSLCATFTRIHDSCINIDIHSIAIELRQRE